MSDATFTHPTFLYLKGEGRLFQTGEAIPADAEGWSDTPAGFVPDSADKPLTVPELAEALAHTPAVGGQAADFVLPPPDPQADELAPDPRGLVEIPSDWEGLHWMKQKAIGEKLQPGEINNGKEAHDAIRAELARRQALAEAAAA
jgi:hypothetical protein